MAAAKRIVVKIGSALLVSDESGGLRMNWLEGLAADVAALRERGKDVILVSSGSIALGRRVLALPAAALSLEQSQAAAAVGQIRLAQAYESVLAPRGIKTAQVLVTLEDSERRRRYLNTRRTLGTLLELGVVPIVNENDTVATDEIRYGDNDRLAAQVASMAGADHLLLLSDVDGLYTANPREDAGARRFASVARITPRIEAMAGGAGSALSKGGMKTKLLAAKVAVRAGCAMSISLGAVERPIRALEEGAACTWFEADGDPRAARKRWILGMKPRGRLTIDAGALDALMRGKSLLPAGVRGIDGEFLRGDPVEIAGPDGDVVAKALAGYDSTEARLIMGHRSHRIAELLGHPGRAALVHRDDMAL
ncbi:glutamate 5-kinase [Amaricoccus solimangrovi]|uniref:Glutamate 5-kinase n=1 Tax=Amaricoccus solimangrovi TaxID=2589815 RepID=A0A501WZH3_9RHOB|nr:glutamate 5-kinase [Amaricoccus solimangrovi]TPE51516.1 glutamate 5-kinase [Amaricoccus solimangrovi]